MGDGRYFTFVQFYNMFILCLLVVFILVSTMISYYRNTRKEGSRYLIAIFIQMNIIVVARFIEEVIVSINIAKSLRYTQNILIIISCMTFSAYLVRYVIPIFRQSKINITKKKYQYQSNINDHDHESKLKIIIKKASSYWSIILGLAIIIYELTTSGNLIIEKYLFNNVIYTRNYEILLSLNILILTTISIKMYTSNTKKQTKRFAFYRNKIFSMIIFLMCIIPLCIYLLAVINHSHITSYIEFLFYFMFTIVINLSVLYFAPYNMTPLVFDSIGDILVDYAFISNKDGDILYKNKKADYGFFKNTDKIDVSDIRTLFSGNIVEKWDKQGKLYIELTNNKEVYYFSYKERVIKNKNKVIGNIITITDITKLINTLNSLERKKEEAEKANKELRDYSKVVYFLEKEKKINDLLEEIANLQEDKMLEIVSRMEKAIIKINDEDFEEYIDNTIDLANDNLNRVRKVVSTYKEYYGG